MACKSQTIGVDSPARGRNVILSLFCILALALNIATTAEAGEALGYCTVNQGTTDGAGGETVTVDNLTDLRSYVSDDDTPYIVRVKGTLSMPDGDLKLNSNKTIIGLGADATIIGCLRANNNKNNIVVRNLTITNPKGYGSEQDGVIISNGCKNIWFDHCTFLDCPDELFTVKGQCDWVTVSWCKFYYSDNYPKNNYGMLIGASDGSIGNRGKLHVTIHHSWFGKNIGSRMPRVRFGRVHMFNNYLNSKGKDCIRVALECEILTENNCFHSVRKPWFYYVKPGQIKGTISSSGDIFDNVRGWNASPKTKGKLAAEANGLNPPPYTYSLDPAEKVSALVTAGAGAGKGPFSPANDPPTTTIDQDTGTGVLSVTIGDPETDPT